MGRKRRIDKLSRRRGTRPIVRVVPTIVRRVARFLGNLVKRVGRVVGSIVRR